MERLNEISLFAIMLFSLSTIRKWPVNVAVPQDTAPVKVFIVLLLVYTKFVTFAVAVLPLPLYENVLSGILFDVATVVTVVTPELVEVKSIGSVV